MGKIIIGSMIASIAYLSIILVYHHILVILRKRSEKKKETARWDNIREQFKVKGWKVNK